MGGLEVFHKWGEGEVGVGALHGLDVRIYLVRLVAFFGIRCKSTVFFLLILRIFRDCFGAAAPDKFSFSFPLLCAAVCADVPLGPFYC